jgi:predicted transcriptional regulator
VVATEVMLIAVCVLATEFLHKAKQAKDVAIEDLRDAISFLRVAAQRFTNLATMHLGVPVHFMKVNRAGIIYKAYANDGVELPSDGSGSVEGQRSVPLLDDPTGVRTTRLESAATPEQARRASAELRERMCHRDNYFGEIEMAAADLLAATGYEDGAITRHVVEGWRRTWVFDCCTRRTCPNAPAG